MLYTYWPISSSLLRSLLMRLLHVDRIFTFFSLLLRLYFTCCVLFVLVHSFVCVSSVHAAHFHCFNLYHVLAFIDKKPSLCIVRLQFKQRQQEKKMHLGIRVFRYRAAINILAIVFDRSRREQKIPLRDHNDMHLSIWRSFAFIQQNAFEQVKFLEERTKHKQKQNTLLKKFLLGF